MNQRTIKVRAATHERIQQLIALVRQRGWGAVGLARTDAPTIAAMVDAALAQLGDATNAKRTGSNNNVR